MTDIAIKLPHANTVTFQSIGRLNIICSKSYGILDALMYKLELLGFTTNKRYAASCHYTELQSNIESLMQANDTVFITTQSMELIRAAHKVLGDDLSYYRLDETATSVFEAVHYSAETLQAAFHLDYEIR